MATARVASGWQMEREANYTVVGAFVLLVIGMAAAFVYWYSDARGAKSYERHEIYFEGSVSGLTVGSTVRYLGVDIGRVVDIRLDPRAATRVQVIADIDQRAPISEQTVAELSLLGVTGLLYIDLLGDVGKKRLADPVASEQYPVIRSVRSNFDVLLSGVPEVMGRASEVAQRANQLLSDENLRAMSGLVTNLDRASRSLPETMREVDALVRDLRATTADLGAAAQSLRGTTEGAAPAVTAAVQRLGAMADNLATTSARLDRFVAENADGVTEFTRNGLPEIERLVIESRAAADELRALSRSLRDEPSRLIYPPASRGVEVPR
jgi:phospholipid/cholesterol/gamma-HCH transport system substrate-binding protein